MRPSDFHFEKKADRYQLCLGEFTTLAGLSLLNQGLKVNILEIGAIRWQDGGWATKEDFPDWKKLAEVTSFLAKDEEFALVNFTIELEGLGRFSSYL